MPQHIKNFSPAEYFGLDGEDPKHGHWRDWVSGDDDLFGADYGQFIWWHLSAIMLLFAEIETELRAGKKHSPLSFEKALNDYLSLVEIHSERPLALVHPFQFETVYAHLPDRTAKMDMLLQLAYGVWCVDRLIDALRADDTKVAAMASTYAVRALELVYEDGSFLPEEQSRKESKRQSDIARQRHASSEKRKALLQVKECWDRWQVSPNDYKSKAAFARAMLDKFENLESSKYIEDQCRAWERKKRKDAGILSIVPAR
jgi:hypothetical protein